MTREGSVLSTLHCGGVMPVHFIVGVMPVTREDSVLITLLCGCHASDKGGQCAEYTSLWVSCH